MITAIASLKMSEEGKADPCCGPRVSPPAPSAGAKRENNGWNDRGFLQHRDEQSLIQSITFRLEDSLPQHVIDDYSNSDDESKRIKIVEQNLDKGRGKCWLKIPEIADLVQGAFKHFDGERYRLLAWVVMPNHVHVLIEQSEKRALGEIVKSWKGFTTREANRILDRSGQFWAEDYFDRYIRNVDHLDSVIAYIHENPVKARLCAGVNDWHWSSAPLPRKKPKVRPSADGWY